MPPTSPAPKPPKLVEEAPRPAEVEVHLGLPAARTCRGEIVGDRGRSRQIAADRAPADAFE